MGFLMPTHNPDHEFSDATEPHGCGFLVGHIARLGPAIDEPKRWMIEIDKFARINIPGLWGGWRNPVRYTTLEDLGIDVDTLTFEEMPEREQASTARAAAGRNAVAEAGLTIAQAKAGLAATYGVGPEAIEIVIRR
ncbi:hypothetical protein [Nocardia sp. NPDC059229]|uniref:hypothetical protein n=1 Tax=Nocardia sp. NPDC059229 TaxID=3346778 RepID=UPI0036A34D61